VTSQFDSGAIELGLAKSLLWLPLELSNDGGGSQVMLRYAIGRTVSAEVLAQTASPSVSTLRIAIFSPSTDVTDVALPHAKAEVEAVAKAARSWGAQVQEVRSDAPKSIVLEAICNAHIFHYAGHAEFLPDAAGGSHLPLVGDRLTAAEVARALSSTPNELMLAFINGCGSSREASWERASEVYGFGSAFLNNATYFIGSQWPIEDEFASALAAQFYASLFPPSYSLWWRILRRNPLVGAPFAEALRLARCHLRQMGPAATQTWASYVFYGDPTRRLVLR
jgi:CHAT domain-containing protein